MLTPEMMIYVIGCLDLTAVSMLMPIITSHVMELGASPALTGLISSMYGAVQLLSSPIMGSLSDAVGRKSLLVTSLIGASLGYALVGLSPLILLYVFSRIFLGIFKHTQTLCRAYIADITLPEERAKVFGLFNSSSSIGFILGPIVGGHLGELKNGFLIVCLTASFIFIINMVLVLKALPDVVKKDSKKSSSTGGSFSSLREIPWKDFWDLFLLRYILSFAVILYRSNNTVIIQEQLGLSKATLGYVVSFQGLVSTIGGFGMGHITRLYNNQSRKLLFHAICLQGFSFMGLSIAWNLFQVLFFLLLLCISNTVCRIGVTKLIIDKTKCHQLGAVMGLSQSVTSIARMIAPVVAGILQEWSLFGPNIVATTFSITGFVVLATSVTLETKLKSEAVKKVN